MVNGKNVSDVAVELLKSGVDWHLKKYNKDPDLAELEDAARKDRIGLWSKPDPMIRCNGVLGLSLA